MTLKLTVHRRSFIKIVISLAVSATACLQSKIANAIWIAEHFAPGEFSDRFERLFAGEIMTDTTNIHINLPTTAENGAVVPITISSELEQIEHLYIWVEKNPTPLAAEFEISKDVMLYMTARIKMAESSNVVVIAKQAGRLLRCQQWVNVMQGGCGTG